VEVWQKTAPQQWVPEGGTTWLSQNDNFSLETPPRRRPMPWRRSRKRCRLITRATLGEHRVHRFHRAGSPSTSGFSGVDIITDGTRSWCGRLRDRPGPALASEYEPAASLDTAMSDTPRRLPSGLATGDEGMTLIETLAALALLLVLMAGLMSVAAVTLKITENQGNLAARTTEYAQDKMEQLLALTHATTRSPTRACSRPPARADGPGRRRQQPGRARCRARRLPRPERQHPAARRRPRRPGSMRVWQVTSPSGQFEANRVTATVRWGFGGSMAPAST
jgi:prepilin-type N-terminal cleavage/methylation domain-containing protein